VTNEVCAVLQSSFSFLLKSISSVLPLIGVMALIALVEVFVPLHARNQGGRRVRVNLALMVLTLGLNFLLSAALVIALALRPFGAQFFFQVPDNWWAVLLLIVVLDFATWVAHLLLHKIPILWRLHLVHHTDRLVDVTTSFRQHPGEGLWRFVVIACVAVPLDAPPEVLTLYRSLSALNALFEHGNFRTFSIIDRWLAPVWVTPNLHKLHHSSDVRDTDTNYGNLLSVFDRMFRTYTPPGGAAEVSYGISSYRDAAALTFKQILQLPFAHKKSRS
jgi:sterol desaturase/sphingolipid hydroxylase (fatty acid hydroxylase superfamily)